MAKSKNIDLEALGTEPKKAADAPVLKKDTGAPEELGLVLSGAKSPAPPKDRSMATLNDEHQKLIYIIDHSGSSADIVAGPEAIAAYVWDAQTMTHLETLVSDAVKEMEAAEQAAMTALSGDDPDDEDAEDAIVDMPSVSKQVQQLAAMKGLTGDALKIEFIKTGLVKAHVTRDWGKINDEITKLGLVKRMFNRIVTERYQKYPNADVSCLIFNYQYEWVPARTKDEMLRSLAAVKAEGGTNIYGAVATALEVCTGAIIYHLVLVTDGQDSSGKNLPDLLPMMQDLKVVLDFIFLLQPGDVFAQDTAAVIQGVVEKTGGIYKEVAGSAEFEAVFIEASNRKLLTAGS